MELTLKRKDGSVERATGGGYADRSISTVALKALATQWIRFRALGSADLLVLGREAIGGGFSPLWIRRAGKYQKLERFTLQRSGEKNSPSMVIEAKGPRPFTLRTDSLLFRHAPMDDLGLFAGVVVPFTGSQITYTFRATLTEPNGKKVSGSLEVTIPNE